MCTIGVGIGVLRMILSSWVVGTLRYTEGFGAAEIVAIVSESGMLKSLGLGCVLDHERLFSELLQVVLAKKTMPSIPTLHQVVLHSMIIPRLIVVPRVRRG